MKRIRKSVCVALVAAVAIAIAVTLVMWLNLGRQAATASDVPPQLERWLRELVDGQYDVRRVPKDRGSQYYIRGVTTRGRLEDLVSRSGPHCFLYKNSHEEMPPVIRAVVARFNSGRASAIEWSSEDWFVSCRPSSELSVFLGLDVESGYFYMDARASK